MKLHKWVGGTNSGILFCFLGVGLTILSYGGESTISAYSVKQLMSRQELQKFVDIFVGEINKASGLERCRS